MALKPEHLTAKWTIEQEMAGVPGLVGIQVRIEKMSGVNPQLQGWVITPVGTAEGDTKMSGIFNSIKPRVIAWAGDKLLCSMGIIARKVP
jgi:hypothetical protein